MWESSIFHEFIGGTSQAEELGKNPNSKTQQGFRAKSIFDELELAMRMNTSFKTSHG
jgi:hypothetical protein